MRVRAGLSFLCGLFVVSSCSSPSRGPTLAEMEMEAGSRAAPAFVEAHREGVAARTLPRTEAAGSLSLPDEAEIAKAIDEVIAKTSRQLRTPARATTFRDFESDANRDLQKTARTPEVLARALGDGLSLMELESFTFARNAKIAESWRRLRSSIERYPQIVHVEVLSAQYAAFLADLKLGAGPPVHKNPVSMRTPSPGVLALKADLVRREVDLAREAFVRTVRDRMVAAHGAFFDHWYLGRTLTVQREVISNLQQLERTVSSRLEAGRADKSHLIQVQVQLSSLEDGLITTEERLKTSRARLREILDLGTEIAIGRMLLPASPPRLRDDEPALHVRAARDRQELRMARDRVKRIETAIALAEKMTYPDWTLGLGYFKGIRPSDRPGAAPGVLPRDFGQRPPGARSYWFAQRESYLREVREVRLALLEAVKAEERRTEFLVRKEMSLLDEAVRRLKLHDEILLAQARQAYEDTLTGYQSDRVEFLNVIDSLRQWLRFDLERDRARRDVFVGFVRLEAAVGGQLPR